MQRELLFYLFHEYKYIDTVQSKDTLLWIEVPSLIISLEPFPLIRLSSIFTLYTSFVDGRERLMYMEGREGRKEGRMEGWMDGSGTKEEPCPSLIWEMVEGTFS